MLKWDLYSSLVMPPFPTSSMSGSVSVLMPILLLSRVSLKLTRIYIDYSKVVTVPGSWSCVRCPSIVLVGYHCHANKQKTKRETSLSSCFIKSGEKPLKNRNLFQLSWISPVVLQLLPISPAQVAGSSCPLHLQLSFLFSIVRPKLSELKHKSIFFLTSLLTIHTKRRIWIFLNLSELCSSLDIFLLGLSLYFRSYHTLSNQSPVEYTTTKTHTSRFRKWVQSDITNIHTYIPMRQMSWHLVLHAQVSPAWFGCKWES